uniref:Tyrosine-protein kinase n=2 Tax=Steinernema glaseri TaxID=37863 RepID=A0A1I7Z9F4_9BILA
MSTESVSTSVWSKQSKTFRVSLCTAPLWLMQPVTHLSIGASKRSFFPPRLPKKNSAEEGKKPSSDNAAKKTTVAPPTDAPKTSNKNAKTSIITTAKLAKSNPPGVPPKSSGGAEKEEGKKLDNELSKMLTIHQWYHGLMPREEIEEMVKNEGEFIVRKTEMQGEARYAISVMHAGRLRHILLQYKESRWCIRDVRKPSLSALIEHFMKTKADVQSDGSKLLLAVPRPEYYILHDHVEVKERIGGGAFGDVHKGILRRVTGETIDVAIKTLKGAIHKKQRTEFTREARLNRKFDHPNIVRLFGIAPQCEPLMIILELAPAGSVKSHLKKFPTLSIEILNNYVKDACRGMCYLAGRRVIHRDIAARNCLLGKNMEVKISDFGLSVANKDVLKLDKLKSMPIKWLAPETLRKGEFSTKTDVWSFGVLIWEIYSRCQSDPFPGETNVEAKTKVCLCCCSECFTLLHTQILSGTDPMVAPHDTPNIPATVMKLCFTQNSEERPEFDALLKLLSPKETPPPRVLTTGTEP